jgi:hypothetical protein
MKNAQRVHLQWAFSVLTGVLIVVATVRMPSSQRLTDLTTFAATVASLILAVYAIFQANLAGNESARSSAQARELNARTETLLQNITSSLPEIRRGVDDIKHAVIGQDYSQTPGTTLSTDAGQIAQAPAATAAANAPVRELTTKDLTVLVTSSTPAGLLALQVAILSHREREALPFNLYDSQMMWHTLGVISGLAAAQWMTFFFESKAPLPNLLTVKTLDARVDAQFDLVMQALGQLDQASEVAVNSRIVSAYFGATGHPEPAVPSAN